MGSYITNNAVHIIFGLTTLVTSALALHYRRQEHRRVVEEAIDDGCKGGLFHSREAMIRYRLSMYARAGPDDFIWAQCVRCTNLTTKVRAKILEAAGRGRAF